MTFIILIASCASLVGFALAAARVSPSRSDREPLLDWRPARRRRPRPLG